MEEKTTTVRISREANKKLDQIVKALRIYTKGGILEDLIEILHKAVQKELAKGNGDRFVLLAKPRYQNRAIIIPITSVEFVIGKFELPMSVSEEEADKLVNERIKKDFEEIEK